MQQFDLSVWLKDKSRKVVTRTGNPVRIICTDRKHDLQIVFLETCNGGGEFLLSCKSDGRYNTYDTQHDLFFADEEEKLTEFEKEYKNLYTEGYADGQAGSKPLSDKVLKECAIDLLDLARSELQPEFDKEMDKMLAETDKVVYQKGREDALKDLPKLEKTKDAIDPTIPVMYTCAASMNSYVEYNGYKVCINELFEYLPKE